MSAPPDDTPNATPNGPPSAATKPAKPARMTTPGTGRPVGETLFGWTQHPAAPAAFAVGLGMTLAALIALEALVPLQEAGTLLDGRLGVHAALGVAGAVLALGCATLIRGIPGMTDEADDADQS